MGILKNKESMIRVLNQWDSQTYDDAMSEMRVAQKDLKAFELLKTVIKKQNLNQKHMNGFSTEGLKTTEKEKLGICYVDFYNQMEDSDKYWTPASLLMSLCQFTSDRQQEFTKKASKFNLTFETLVTQMCGRLLRALPSYIREEQLSNSLIAAFPSATFERSPSVDKYLHCDIKMTLKGETYYIWSFMNTQRSIINFAKKFNGTRGPTPIGKHLLCPFNRGINTVTYHGWCFYAKQNTDDVLAAVYQLQPLEYHDALENKLIYSTAFFRKPVVIMKNVA